MSDYTRLPSAFLIEGASYPAVALPLDPSWPAIARSKGFDILGRVVDRYRCVLRCHDCRSSAVVRINVMRDHAPLCHACIQRRRAAAAKAIGAELIAADAQHRHYGHFRLSSGHVVRRQYLRAEKAAAGGHAIDCPACRETRYGTEAQAFGWNLAGRAKGRRPGYRRYRHRCGHRQDVSIGNMAWGDTSCGGCAANWAGKPSFIYLFRYHLGADMPQGDLASLARQGAGMTPADVKAAVQEARSLARAAKRALTLDDLVAAIGTAHPPIPTALRRRIAIHEAGHVVAAHVTGNARPLSAVLSGDTGHVEMLPLPHDGSAAVVKRDLRKLLREFSRFHISSSGNMWTNFPLTSGNKKPSGAAMSRFLHAKKDRQGRRRAQQGQTVYRLHTLLSDKSGY